MTPLYLGIHQAAVVNASPFSVQEDGADRSVAKEHGLPPQSLASNQATPESNPRIRTQCAKGRGENAC